MERQSIVNPMTKAELDAAFEYDDFLFFFDRDEIDDNRSTVAQRLEDGEIICGKEANNLLAENVDTYCREHGKVWMSDEFKPVVRLRRKCIG